MLCILLILQNQQVQSSLQGHMVERINYQIITLISQHRPIPTSISQHHPIPTSVSQHRPIPSSISQHHPILTSVSQHHPIPTSISQHRPILTSISQHRYRGKQNTHMNIPGITMTMALMTVNIGNHTLFICLSPFTLCSRHPTSVHPSADVSCCKYSPSVCLSSHEHSTSVSFPS